MRFLSPKILALLGLFLTNLFWAGNAVVARYASADVPPFALAFGRWLLALLVLLPFVWSHLQRNMRLIRQRWQVIFVLGILGVAVYNTILYLAAHSTTAVNITLVSSSLPLVTLLMSALMLKTRPSLWQMLGIVVSLAGVLMVITRGDPGVLSALRFNLGDVQIFLIACVWAIYSVILRKYPVELPAAALLAVLMVAGMPMLFVLMLLEWYLLPAHIWQWSPEVLVTFVYVALFPSICAYLFWGYGVRVLGPNMAALSCYLMPLLTALLAVPLLGEELYRYHFIGGAMILCGLYLGSVFRQVRA